MAQNDQNTLSKLLDNKQMLAQLAGSADAQALAALLQREHDSEQLAQLAQSAVSGNAQSMKDLVQAVTGSPEGKDLLRRLSESFRSN